jgi:hypothetical protein
MKQKTKKTPLWCTYHSNNLVVVQAFAYVRRTGSATLGYVLSLASASPAKKTRRAVGEQDGHRVVVRLGEELAWRRDDDLGLAATRERPLSVHIYPPHNI